MTIFVRASKVHAPGNNYCSDGPGRVAEVLPKLGITPDTPVSMAVVVEHFLLTDALFAMAYVDKQSVSEARAALGAYIAYVATIAEAEAQQEFHTGDARRLIDKRAAGHPRPELAAKVRDQLASALSDSIEPRCKYAASALVCLLDPDRPDHIAACNATVQLVKAAECRGQGKEMLSTLREAFLDYVGREMVIGEWLSNG